MKTNNQILYMRLNDNVTDERMAQLIDLCTSLFGSASRSMLTDMKELEIVCRDTLWVSEEQMEALINANDEKVRVESYTVDIDSETGKWSNWNRAWCVFNHPAFEAMTEVRA